MSQTIPVKNKIFTQPFVVVGAIIEKDGKFLLVQEARKERGKWNQPAGWLDLKEDVIEGAKREAFEETGLEIKIKGLLGIYPLVKNVEDVLLNAVKIIFAAEALDDNIKFDPDEVMDAKWFTLEEMENLDLRDADIIKEVKDYLAGEIYPLSAIKSVNDMTM